MEFNTVIIGGGLSGLTCGIKLAEEGQRVLIVNAGQSSLHYSSGSFDLLGYNGKGETVTDPIAEMTQLDAGHPYAKITDHAARAREAQALLQRAGLHVDGSEMHNHFRLTPIGIAKPTWLTLEGMLTMPSADAAPWKTAAVIHIEGFLDFPSEFFQAELNKMGVAATCHTISTPELEYARQSPTEMRATNIARMLCYDDNLRRVADAINNIDTQADVVILPAVLGLCDRNCSANLGRHVHRPLLFAPTMPPSVPGSMIQQLLFQRFDALGGTIINNNSIVEGRFAGRLEHVISDKMPDTPFRAGHFVLATGSFVSGGVEADYTSIKEPVFGLDTETAQRSEWHNGQFFDQQPYMRFGVKTDEHLRTSLKGKTVDNLYAIGDVLSGNDAMTMADKEGVEMLTALEAAYQILQTGK